MQPHEPAPSLSGRRPSSDGADAARALGDDVLATVDLEAVAARLQRLPSAALLGELEAAVAAIDRTDPARSRRHAGWWGRLLGRDLVAQAQPDPVEDRVRLHLSAARTHADSLAAQTAELASCSAHLQAQGLRLEALVGETRASVAEPTASLQRRLSHLDAIAASWRATIAQIAMVRDHASHLLDRHAQVRDLLLALWQERNAAHAAATQLAPERTACLREALRDLHASAPSLAAPAADPDRPTQEPTP